VVLAAEHITVAALVRAHQVGAVPAPVEQDADLAVLAAHHDDRLQADLPADVIAVVGHFAVVSEIDPDLVEDVVHFLAKQLGIMIEPSVNTIGLDQFADVDVRRGYGVYGVRHDGLLRVV
jgi:hypothetical protein